MPAGSGFGLTASLIKLCVAALSDGGVPAQLSRWQRYAFVVTGLGDAVIVVAALSLAGATARAQLGPD
jgi:hypothetical protein